MPTPPESRPFEVVADHQPAGDQPQAIKKLVSGIAAGVEAQTLLGVTGSGKTYTVAHVIARSNRPALVLAHNKTLAAQLYQELKSLLPNNAVEYFVSYYDYYQPEAYIASTDTYIEKDSRINEEIDKLRHRATRSVLMRRDTVVVASVSCIFGIGSPEEYGNQLAYIKVGEEFGRDTLLRKLTSILYERNNYDFHRGVFRVRGDVVEVFPIHEQDEAIRVTFFGDEVEAIHRIDPLTGSRIGPVDEYAFYPATHWVTDKDTLKVAIGRIQEELREQIQIFKDSNRLIEAQRIEQRTYYDIEMLEQAGWCPGIENYTRHLSGRNPGDPPSTLVNYFPDDFLLFIDESHVTIPQVRGMYHGDRSRKTVLVEHGFRLPSALDNRPLTADEFKKLIGQVVYVSATPGDAEIAESEGHVVEMINRPTGLIDPRVEVRPAEYQVDDLQKEIVEVVSRGSRVLVTTLTKKMAEHLAEYYAAAGIRTKYLHSDIETLERVEILRDLRLGTYDVLIGVNLLREGLDLPEVELVAILDADKEGFLRSTRSLIQTTGRASRNLNGHVIMYADRITDSMRRAIDETNRRRTIQTTYNEEHGITPTQIIKAIGDQIVQLESAQSGAEEAAALVRDLIREHGSIDGVEKALADIEEEMHDAARKLDFEAAAHLRDKAAEIRKALLEIG